MNSETSLIRNSLESLINEGKSKLNTDIRDDIVSSIYATSKSLCNEAVSYQKEKSNRSDTLDSIFTSRILGFPIMLLMLGVVFYITIAGANVPSSMIAEGFGWAEGHTNNRVFKRSMHLNGCTEFWFLDCLEEQAG